MPVANLKSSESACISITFERRESVTNSNKPARLVTAVNALVKVERADLDPQDTVEVVINNDEHFVGNSNGGGQVYDRTDGQIATLECSNGVCWGPIRDLLLFGQYYDGASTTAQRVAVAITDDHGTVWQSDPLQPNQTFKDFNVNMSQA